MRKILFVLCLGLIGCGSSAIYQTSTPTFLSSTNEIGMDPLEPAALCDEISAHRTRRANTMIILEDGTNLACF